MVRSTRGCRRSSASCSRSRSRWCSVERGEYVHVDGKGSDCALAAITEGETYRVVHAPNGSDATTLAEVRIETPPDSPSYSC
jgi:hypothetical protein